MCKVPFHPSGIMGLCNVCSSITLVSLTSLLSHPPEWTARELTVLKSQGQMHLSDACGLPTSARCCALCSLILKAIRRGMDTSVDPTADFEQRLATKPIYLCPKSDPLGRVFPDPPIDGLFLTGFTIFVPLKDGVVSSVIRLYTSAGNGSNV